MIVINNDYMINERGLDLRSRLKVNDNQSGAVEIFLSQLSFRLLDYIISNSTRFKDYEQVNAFINKMSDFNKEMYKRAIAEQAIYMLSVGDKNYIDNNGALNQKEFKSARICPQTKDILRNLGLLVRTAQIYDGYGGRMPFYSQDFDDEFTR